MGNATNKAVSNGNNNSPPTSTSTSPQAQQQQNQQQQQQQQQPAQHQQVTYMIAPSMMYQPFTIGMNGMSINGMQQIPYTANGAQLLPQNMYQTQQRQSMQKRPISADQQQPDSNTFYVQQMALQQPQFQPHHQPQPQYAGHHPFYAPTAHQQRSSAAYYQPPHSIYAAQQPLIYAAPQSINNAELNQSDIQITNFHNKQQPKPEPKSLSKSMNNDTVFAPVINKRNTKKKKNTSTQSDSLLRKKKHRRSLSNTLPNKNRLQSHFTHHHTTPPPGPLYSDQLNAASAHRGIIGNTSNSNGHGSK